MWQNADQTQESQQFNQNGFIDGSSDFGNSYSEKNFPRSQNFLSLSASNQSYQNVMSQQPSLPDNSPDDSFSETGIPEEVLQNIVKKQSSRPVGRPTLTEEQRKARRKDTLKKSYAKKESQRVELKATLQYEEAKNRALLREYDSTLCKAKDMLNNGGLIQQDKNKLFEFIKASEAWIAKLNIENGNF